MMNRKVLKVFVILLALVGGVLLVKIEKTQSYNYEIKANAGYSTGDQVYIGNELYTVIDPTKMTLLANNLTDVGNVTWNEAVTSLSTLPPQYGELGSKAVQGNLSLPTSLDLAKIKNADNTTLTTISPSTSDWWLGDASVDNRSKFVGANDSSLVKGVDNIQNVIDNTHVCQLNKTVTQYGLKPTIDGKDPETTDVYNVKTKEVIIHHPYAYYEPTGLAYSSENCSDEGYISGGSMGSEYSERFYITDGRIEFPNGVHNGYLTLYFIQEKFSPNWTPGESFEVDIPNEGMCLTVNNVEPYDLSDSNSGGVPIKSVKVRGREGIKQVVRYDVTSVSAEKDDIKTIICEGAEQIAGTSSVRPLLTLDENTIIYTNDSKSSFSINSLISQTKPMIDSKNAYISMLDSDLKVTLDSSNSQVEGTTYKAKRSDSSTIVSIPVSLGGETGGTRYVSAIATTSNGEQYGVLGQINGTTGTVDLDISNFPDYDTTDSLSLTLYQEVDEGTNTTYIGEGTPITLSFVPAITGITFTPNYPQNKTDWNFGDSGINASGEKTGAFTFTGGTSGIKDATTGKDYKAYEIVDTNGNVITDTNFTISGNELHSKGQVPVGTYTLNIKVTDNNDETYTDTITIDVGKAENPFDWIDDVKNTSSIYYGHTLTLGVTGIGEGATVTYEPSPEVNGTTFTAGKPISKFTVTAKATETSSYGETSKTHDFKIEKRPIYVKVQQKDSIGAWKDSVTIKQGQPLPNKQVIENTSEANNKGLASTESSVTDAKLGTITYEYRQGNTKVTDPSSKAGTYDVVAVYTNSDYYTVTVKKSTLIVTAPDTIDNTNKESYYEFQLSNGSKADITKWQTEDIIIHPKHSSYTQMKVDSGTYQTGDQTYTKEGKNDVSLNFKDGSGATTSTIKETLKIDKTNPTLTKVEVGELNGSVQAPGNGTFHYLLKNGADYKITASDAQSGIAKYNVTVTPLKSDGTIDSSKQPKKTSTPSTSGTFGGSIAEQGFYQLDVEVEDAAGRKTSANPIKIKVKSTQTTLEVKGYVNGDTNKPYDSKKWINQSIKLKLNASDNTTLTNPQISTDGTSFTAMTNGKYTVANTSSINGETYYFKATNIDGDEVSTSIKINIDVDAPSAPNITWKDKSQNVIASIINTLTFDKVFSKEVIASFTSTDPLSGVDTYSYKITEVDNKGNVKGSPITGKGASYSLSKNKNYKVEVTATDKAGNTSIVSTKTVQIDTEAPVISGVKDKNEYKQYYLPRYISVADSLSGVKTATYKIGSVTKDIVGEVNIMGVGEYQVYAEDYAGNKVTLNFKIVPLPDLSDIDGTDESKAIIDQIQKELDEIKNKIDQTQKDDYQEWIDDATEKWDSLRKKVVEHEETTSKVEGQGDTTFDPKTQLIVEEIPKEQVPVLPRNAIKTYDVRLMKGDKEVLPNGDIKVYLPYTEQETPIVYELNDDGSIKELTAKQENGYVTFVTNTLKKYAISNTAQKENKPNVCVVGPDNKADSNDDVCGSDGSKKNDDGSVTVPDGGKVIFPDKEIDAPDGAIIHPDGSVDFPDGTHFDPDGNETTKPDPKPDPKPNPDDGKKPDDNNNPTDDKVCAAGPDGKLGTSDDVCGEGNGTKDPEKKPDGSIEIPDGGSVIFPDGSEVELPDGGTIKPDGSVELPDGTIYDPNGNKKDPNDSDKKECKLEGKDINVDTDGDGLPDLNLDINNDCIAELNIDTNFDNIPDINIDSTGNGTNSGQMPKANINVDTNNDGKAELNLAIIKQWIPNKNDCVYNGFKYDTMTNIEPYLNVDDNGDGTPDRNIDDDGDGTPDRNIDSDWFDKYGSKNGNTNTDSTVQGTYTNNDKTDKNTGGVSTGDQTKWVLWWILLIGTGGMIVYSYKRKHN